MAGDSTRVREEYDELSADYERRWHRYIERTVGETLSRAQLSPRDRVLDVGCGTGALLGRIAASCSAGVDLSVAMLDRARTRLGPIVAAGDAERLPFRDGSFDAVLSTSSFHFWPAPERALGEIHRVLRPSGRLVLTDWCDDFLACRLYERVSGGRVYGGGECERLLRDARFAIERLDRYKVSWLWGMMTVSATRA